MKKAGVSGAKVTVRELFNQLAEPLQLECVAGCDGNNLDRKVPGSDISSPGLALAGYVGRFVSERLQVLGETEITYLSSLDVKDRKRLLEIFYSFELPAVFVTKGQNLPPGLAEAADKAAIPLIRTTLKTAEFYSRIKPVLEDMFAPTMTLHGSLADVFGVGLLFTGKSGIGKSECVLDLVERGHRLVADDVIITKRRGNGILIGSGHHLQQHHMEIRGVGIIDIPSIFGIRAVRQQKRIEVVVNLEEWNQDTFVDRTGLDTQTADVLGVQIPKITIPLNPGKNITVISEVIAMNHLLRYTGVDPVQEFNNRLIENMRTAAQTRREYLREDNE